MTDDENDLQNNIQLYFVKVFREIEFPKMKPHIKSRKKKGENRTKMQVYKKKSSRLRRVTITGK